MKIIFLKQKNIFVYTIILLICIFIYYNFFTKYINITKEVSNNLENRIDINNIYNQNGKIAYLTFDDGPTISVTPKILDILKKHNIKATFFVIGKKVKENPEIVKRTYNDGHFIGNHTYSHNNSILYKNSENFISEIEKTDLEIGKAIGIDNYHSNLFRFPNGFMSNIYKTEKENYVKILSNMGYSYIDWNALNKDSEKKYTNNQLLNNLKQSCKNKNILIVLMHDTKDVNDSSNVLDDSINYLKNQGYTFKNFY